MQQFTQASETSDPVRLRGMFSLILMDVNGTITLQIDKDGNDDWDTFPGASFTADTAQEFGNHGNVRVRVSGTGMSAPFPFYKLGTVDESNDNT